MKRLYILGVSLFCLLSINLKAQTVEDFQKLALTDQQQAMIAEKRMLLLTNQITGKKKRIKEGGYALIQLKHDTTRREAVIEAVLVDTIVVSYLKHKAGDKKAGLIFDEFKSIPMQSIESITYSVRHYKRNFYAGEFLMITGADLVVIPLVVGVGIMGTKIFEEPLLPVFVAGGAIVFLIGKKMLKSLQPKDYDLAREWQYAIVEE
jgi:hypothetical protein